MTVEDFSAADRFEHAHVDTVVVFVDIAGFTAFTEAHGDHLAAELADRFTTIAASVLGPDDEMIKTLGDGVLITSSDPTAALAFLRRLHDEIRRIDGSPLLRAGIDAGSVVKRRGDVFGSTVNTAARLAAIARPGQIVGNAEAAAALHGADRLALMSLGPLRLRNVGALVEAFALDVGTRHQEHVDPICRMHVTTDAESLTIAHQEDTYRFYFCSAACSSQFAKRVGTSSDDGDPQTTQSFVGEVAAHFGTPVPSPAGGNAASTSTSSICS
ncbi:adenylate/guanylate cyclase domain-containing protein [Mycolicibacterium lacusdiani]|jgi:class 3 adenylate cyclase|uniref:adenylate/guanylate cyclase domain-containing protein n=1 Tax=Mycolicibacterium lacusdiani TaxID=2895283 RepID=UPI001F33E852|nr:adenylate/guanylate cyclase domain-containing protein [Mycolicibacterium lacusdiani]